MKTIINYLLLLLPLAAGCVKDNGNYHYAEPPAIEILGIATDTLFRVQQFDTLVLAPTLVATGKAGLEHEWKINNKIVSTDPTLRVEIHEAPNADNSTYIASLRVTDKATGLRYYKNFRVAVTTPFTSGLFILSERADSTAALSFQGRNKPAAPLMHDLFESVNPAFGSLGKKPRQVFHEGSPAQLGVICGEGQYPFTLLNPATLTLLQRHSKESIRGEHDGAFTPAYGAIYMGGMIAGGGKLYSYNFMNNKSLYHPVPGERVFADWIDTNGQLDSYAWVSYDNKAQEFVLLEPGNDMLLYDKMTPIAVQGNLSTTGQRFLAGGHLGATDLTALRAILHNAAERKAYLYGLKIVDNFDLTTWVMTITTTLDRFSEISDIVDANTVCLYDAEYWYLANGNTVRRLHEKGTAPLDWFTAPRGNVTAMIADKFTPRRLFIATHDGTKSYIYAINLATKELLETPLEMEGKIVSMLAKGKWEY